jgi:DnaJ-class molecular chaperone
MKNPYEILGVSPEASEEEIKKAFKEKAFQIHPDRNPDDPNAEIKFKEINEAYQTITNSKNKKFDPYDIYSFIEEMSKNYFFGSFYRRPRASQSVYVEPRPSHYAYDECYDYENLQLVYVEVSLVDAIKGKKSVLVYGKKGTVTLDIPPGTRDGDTFRVHNMSICVLVTCPENVRVDIDGNIFQALEMTYPELYFCRDVNFTTIDGQKLQIKIPKGITPGGVIRIRGKGLPASNHEPAGNLMLMVKLVFPKVSKDKKKIFEKTLEELEKIQEGWRENEKNL